jgi:hypothetical protein
VVKLLVALKISKSTRRGELCTLLVVVVVVSSALCSCGVVIQMRKQFIQKKPKVFSARCEVCVGVPSFKEEAKLTKRRPHQHVVLQSIFRGSSMGVST